MTNWLVKNRIPAASVSCRRTVRVFFRVAIGNNFAIAAELSNQNHVPVPSPKGASS